MIRMADAIILSLFLVSASPSLGEDYGRAADATRRAYLLTENGQQIKDRAERYGKYLATDYLGLDPEDAIYAVWAIPVVTGRISTKPFRGLGWTGDGWSLRPEIEYKLNDSQNRFRGEMVLNYIF